MWRFDSIGHFHIPIIFFVCPPHFACTIVFNFSWKHARSQERLKKNSFSKIWGANKVCYGNVEVATFSQILHLSIKFYGETSAQSSNLKPFQIPRTAIKPF